MSVEDIVDGLAIIQQKRGRKVDQGDVEMLALAIKELRKGRPASLYVPSEQITLAAKRYDWLTRMWPLEITRLVHNHHQSGPTSSDVHLAIAAAMIHERDISNRSSTDG